ncbi:MAG: iron complex transport system substrate-binding protein [Actinomycetota bacterium]|nr:iron complex transport system substrate-binding protein [Actinomycetota bacterium]
MRAPRSYDARVRVVSLLPSATEIMFALDRGDDVVGVTFECDHPPAARSRRVVSTSSLPEGLAPGEIDALVSARIAAGEDLYHLDEQALSDLDADVILTQDLCAVCAVDVERVDDALAYLGCSAEVVTLDPSSLDEVMQSIIAVGEIVGAREMARRLVGALRQRLDALTTALGSAARREVVVLEWTDPPFSAGHWVPDLVALGGGVPLLAHPGRNSERIEWRALRSAPAEVVVVAPCGYHLDAATALARDLVESGRVPSHAEVWAVDADSHFVRPGPRLVDGAEVVSQILHPERVGPPPEDRARRVTTDR